MTFKCLALPFLGVLTFTLIVKGADAPGPKLASQASTDKLDGVADLTHGLLKWSHGAFLYMDATGGVAPSILHPGSRGEIGFVNDVQRARRGEIFAL